MESGVHPDIIKFDQLATRAFEIEEYHVVALDQLERLRGKRPPFSADYCTALAELSQDISDWLFS